MSHVALAQQNELASTKVIPSCSAQRTFLLQTNEDLVNPLGNLKRLQTPRLIFPSISSGDETEREPLPLISPEWLRLGKVRRARHLALVLGLDSEAPAPFTYIGNTKYGVMHEKIHESVRCSIERSQGWEHGPFS